MRGEAEARRQVALLTPGRIRGFDRDPVAIRDAEANAARAGLDKRLFFQRCELEKLPAAPAPTGLVAVNPPYGERIGETDELRTLYALLGERLRADYRGWEAAVFTGNPALGRELGINARRTHRMMNGPIECRLLRLTIDPAEFVQAREPGRPPVIDAEAARARPGAQMFANRLAKNLDRVSGWAKREQVSCFRVYDADMPEYAFAIDLYQSDPVGSAGRWLYVQEYAPPATVDKDRARARREEAISVLPEVTGLAADAIYWRTRRPQKGKSQYEAIAEVDERVVVEEGGLKFLVNFTDYLDTGLFLDHRKTRARIRKLAKGKRFLNLFCYTGAATVHAAAGGAASTTSVDMSRTYVDWAKRNLAINGLRGEHAFVQEDCLAWLAEGSGGPWDLIFLDPPTFSNSKRMDREFDVQRDHVDLIRATLKRLAPGGLLLFSTNFRKFKLDREALAGPRDPRHHEGDGPLRFRAGREGARLLRDPAPLGELLHGLDGDRGHAFAAGAHVAADLLAHAGLPELLHVTGDLLGRGGRVRIRPEEIRDVVGHRDQALDVHPAGSLSSTDADAPLRAVRVARARSRQASGCVTFATSTAVTLYSGQLVAQSEFSVVTRLTPDSGKWKVV